jgi:hypothetical protein
MSTSNGVIRIGRKGLRKFAFGEDGPVFEVDVVVAFQRWIDIDDSFRPIQETEDGLRPIPNNEMANYHQAAVEFVKELSRNPATEECPSITTAEALDFIARLREQYDELAVFFRPKLRKERESPDSSGVELQFSAEAP